MTKNTCNCNGNMLSCHLGIKGKDADLQKILLVLHRPDARILEPTLFDRIGLDSYESALMRTQTGQILSNILDFAGFSIDDVYVTNLLKGVLKEDREPRIDEYLGCMSMLKRQVEEFCPEKIVLFGEPAYKTLFPKMSRLENHRKAIGYKLLGENISAPGGIFIAQHPGKIWRMPYWMQEKHYNMIENYLRE